MLHQISWQAYGAALVVLLAIYYLYVLLAFYRAEIRTFYSRISGKQSPLAFQDSGFIPIPDYEIVGAAQPDEIYAGTEETLLFGPSDNRDEDNLGRQDQDNSSTVKDSRLIGQFSEMVAELKTLIRVISESEESRENFDMLFKIIVQKYPDLGGTPYQRQVTEFLIEEGSDQFPFHINAEDLEAYWEN